MAENLERKVKIIIAGEFGVGKWSLIHRFCEGSYQQNVTRATVGFDFTTKTVVIDEKKITLRIFGTAGQEKHSSSPPSYFREAEGIVLIYDITNVKSFAELGTWMEKIKNAGGGDAIKVLIGNKKDDETRRVVSPEQGQTFATQNGMQFFETSVEEDDNVTEAFYSLVREIKETILDREVNPPLNNRVGLNDNNNTNQGSGCCGRS